MRTSQLRYFPREVAGTNGPDVNRNLYRGRVRLFSAQAQIAEIPQKSRDQSN
jgi:hypothetical protein